MSESVTSPARERTVRFRELVEEAPVGVYVSTPGGRLEFCNATFARMLGFASPADAAGAALEAIRESPAECDHFVERVRLARHLNPHRTRLRRRDGRFIDVLETVIGEFDAAGHLVELRGQVVDIGEIVAMERRRSEERLSHSDRIEPVDRLAGGIAHEFNNLLTAILGYTELLLATCALDDNRRADLEEVRKAAERAAALTRQLLAFGRKQVLVPKDVDLNALVGGLRQRLSYIVHDGIALVIDLSPMPALVSIDPVQFEQALMNLVGNARDALTDGGRIVVSLARADVAAGAIDGAPAGRYVRVGVSDDGRGMPPEVRAHLFEPFFTTKEFGKAAGLGLASVQGIVRQSRGHITVDSAPGSGTAVTMYFPSLDVDAHPAPSEAPAPGATILLVEDEEAVRVIASTVLERAGFRVLEASTPHAACEIFALHRDTIDLLLTDVVMPEMNGPALAQRLVADRPALRVLFISGYAGVAASAFDSDNPNVAFLSKPFQAQALVAQVGELLGRRRPA